MTNRLKQSIELQLSIVDDILTRYIEDEAGESQKDKYKDMDEADKISLLTTTLLTCSDWCDFEIDLVINFDTNNY